MTVDADAINHLSLTSRPRQRILRGQGDLDDKPCDLDVGSHILKLVSANTDRLDITARWKSVANSSSGTQMHGDAGDRDPGSVYERIKSSLLERSWIPGEQLQIGLFARELGTSTTPVREALVRLAAERLIAYTPKKGFLVKAITEEELRGLYIVNQMHLQTALHYSSEQAGHVHQRKLSSAPRPYTEGSDSADLAFFTENLFSSIAASANIEEITTMVCNINNRLHRSRIAEYAVIDRMPQEISAISDLFAAGDRQKLHAAIQRYHELRLRMLASICKEQLSMSFVRQ